MFIYSYISDGKVERHPIFGWIETNDLMEKNVCAKRERKEERG